MAKLIVDCGATKTDWCRVDGKQTRTVRTAGFNLAHTSADTLKGILDAAAEQIGPDIQEVHFYAAGLVGDSPVDLASWFPGAAIEYASDMLGAARAVCGREKGVAAILGTGANTCSYDGQNIGWKVNCGGFIIGDEGAGSVLGKLFITDYLKAYMPQDILREFQEKYQLDYVTVVKNVYSGPAPARFLSQYDKELPVGVVGGFGNACKDILLRLGKEYGVRFSRFMASPVEGLIEYHAL